jgi:hypothetical protein
MRSGHGRLFLPSLFHPYSMSVFLHLERANLRVQYLGYSFLFSVIRHDTFGALSKKTEDVRDLSL